MVPSPPEPTESQTFLTQLFPVMFRKPGRGVLGWRTSLPRLESGPVAFEEALCDRAYMQDSTLSAVFTEHPSSAEAAYWHL